MHQNILWVWNYQFGYNFWWNCQVHKTDIHHTLKTVLMIWIRWLMQQFSSIKGKRCYTLEDNFWFPDPPELSSFLYNSLRVYTKDFVKHILYSLNITATLGCGSSLYANIMLACIPNWAYLLVYFWLGLILLASWLILAYY